jgi:hypothetical protein
VVDEYSFKGKHHINFNDTTVLVTVRGYMGHFVERAHHDLATIQQLQQGHRIHLKSILKSSYQHTSMTSLRKKKGRINNS